MNTKLFLALAATLFIIAAGAYSPAMAQSATDTTEVSEGTNSDNNVLVEAEEADGNDENVEEEGDNNNNNDNGGGGDGGGGGNN